MTGRTISLSASVCGVPMPPGFIMCNECRGTLHARFTLGVPPVFLSHSSRLALRQFQFFFFRAVFKICVIPRFVPRDFGYGIQAREQQFFEVFRRFHLLRPQCRFVTEHIRTVCVALAHDDRLIMVDLIQRIDAMRIIEIQKRTYWRKITLPPRSINAGTGASCCAVQYCMMFPVSTSLDSRTSFQRDGALAVLFENSDDTLCEVALQIFIIGKAKRFHARLAVRAFFPFGLRRFVTADVEAVVGNSAQTSVRSFSINSNVSSLPGQRFLKNAAKLAQLRFFAKAAQMRICRNRDLVGPAYRFRDDLHAAHYSITLLISSCV